MNVMEVKLVFNNQNLGISFSLYPSPSRPRRFRLKSWLRNQESVKKEIENLAGRWSFHVKEMIKGRGGLNKEGVLVHVVKEGETLSSISNQYGVSVNSIATTNRDIVDLDLVYEGQHIRIPSFQGNTQKTQTTIWSSLGSPQRHQRMSKILDNISKQNNFTMLVPPKLPHARTTTTGYFLVLVPLIAFCIRCINAAFCTRIAANRPRHRGGSGGVRWKSALSDIREPDSLDPESDSNIDICSSEDQHELSVEDVSTGYTRLEKDYEKFLLDCGISISGYWRGGDAE